MMRSRRFAILAALAVVLLPSGTPARPLDGLTVVIDPGHGGTNLGALSPDGTPEKEVVLEVATHLARRLIGETGARVVLTRRRDEYLPLRARTRIAEQVSADIFLSLHCNSSPRPGPRGFSIYFLTYEAATRKEHLEIFMAHPRQADDQKEPGGQRKPGVEAIVAGLELSGVHQASFILARTLIQSLKQHLSWPDRGVRRAPFDVLLFNRVPSVVVELGFINHPVEGRLLQRPGVQARLIEALIHGLLEYEQVMRARKAPE